jgi:probable HAF family extracellular repeat protein
MKRLLSMSAISMAVATAVVVAQPRSTQLSIIDLGTLGGALAQAFGLDARSQIVGASTTASGDVHAFQWEKGAMIDLGTLPGGLTSSAAAINSRAQVVGRADTAAGETHAVLWTKKSVGASRSPSLTPESSSSSRPKSETAASP